MDIKQYYYETSAISKGVDPSIIGYILYDDETGNISEILDLNEYTLLSGDFGESFSDYWVLTSGNPTLKPYPTLIYPSSISVGVSATISGVPVSAGIDIEFVDESGKLYGDYIIGSATSNLTIFSDTSGIFTIKVQPDPSDYPNQFVDPVSINISVT